MKSAWTERLTARIVPERSRLWIALDPDRLFLEERIAAALGLRGFEIVPFGDPLSFRLDYELRFRANPDARWIIHLAGMDERILPYDVVMTGQIHRVTVADLFDRLDPNVVRALGPERFDELDAAYALQVATPLAADATKDFISANLFRLSPTAIRSPQDFWTARFDLLFEGDELPTVLADRAVANMSIPPDLTLAEAREILSSNAAFVARVQRDWDASVAAIANGMPVPDGAIPFSSPKIRRSIDTLVLDGAIQPAKVVDPEGNLPAWLKPLVVQDLQASMALLKRRMAEAMADVPPLEADHRAWLTFGRLYATIIREFDGLRQETRSELANDVAELRRSVDRRLFAWLGAKFGMLSSVSPARAPAVVSQIAAHMEHRRAGGAGRMALVVVDGLALDQWLLLEEALRSARPDALVDATAAFAWIPTATSVSRQAIFSGSIPRAFEKTLWVTSAEPRLWRRFWAEAGVAEQNAFYGKGYDDLASVDKFAAEVLPRQPEIIGIVVTAVDEMLHGTVFGKPNLAHQIAFWLGTGAWTRLIGGLLDAGYEVIVSADHGNTDATGIGRHTDGAAPVERSERVRIYESETLRSDLLSKVPGATKMTLGGLPERVLPVFAPMGGAFSNNGSNHVCHGGVSLEEVIVPFVRIVKKAPP